MTLREIKDGERFRLTKNGAVYIKLNEQGMDNNFTYCRSENKRNTKCKRMSYTHRLLYTDTNILGAWPDNSHPVPAGHSRKFS